MEYFLITIFQALGISFHVMQKIIKMGDENKDITRNQVFSIFLREDWDTLAVSVLIWITHLVVHFVVDVYTPEFRSSFNYYILYSFGAAFMLGYLGQRAVYKWLGSAEKKINSIVDEKTK